MNSDQEDTLLYETTIAAAAAINISILVFFDTGSSNLITVKRVREREINHTT
jgi:hypothetical protein